MSRWCRICDKPVMMLGDTGSRSVNLFDLAAREAAGRCEALS
jgi:hypothetical protein